LACSSGTSSVSSSTNSPLTVSPPFHSFSTPAKPHTDNSPFSVPLPPFLPSLACSSATMRWGSSVFSSTSSPLTVSPPFHALFPFPLFPPHSLPFPLSLLC
jgi:hypothetical protein